METVRQYCGNKYVIPYLGPGSEDGMNNPLAAPEDLSDVRDRKDYEREIAPAFVSSTSHKIRIKVGYSNQGSSSLAITSRFSLRCVCGKCRWQTIPLNPPNPYFHGSYSHTGWVAETKGVSANYYIALLYQQYFDFSSCWTGYKLGTAISWANLLSKLALARMVVSSTIYSSTSNLGWDVCLGLSDTPHSTQTERTSRRACAHQVCIRRWSYFISDWVKWG